MINAKKKNISNSKLTINCSQAYSKLPLKNKDTGKKATSAKTKLTKKLSWLKDKMKLLL